MIIVVDRDCGLWAYGEGWQTVLLKDLYHRWNEKHSDIFEIKGFDSVKESNRRIAKAYLVFNQEKKCKTCANWRPDYYSYDDHANCKILEQFDEGASSDALICTPADFSCCKWEEKPSIKE